VLIIGVVTGVLDVRDDTPLMTSPSTSHLPSPPHNRSIVVLTPTQAIKFTALSRERHISWLTALNFLVHNDPADLIIPRGITSSPSHGSLWGRETVYPTSATASSIASSQNTSQPFPPPSSQQSFPFGSYTVRKNSLPDFAPVHAREDSSPLGYKQRYDDEYAKPPSVPRIPTGRRFEGRERSGSGSGTINWEDPTSMGNRGTIRMDAFVNRTPPRHEDIDDNLFREF
jgi:Meiotic cell cortex C-terminal pleckstrin homology